MLIAARLFMLFVVLGIGGSLVLWLLTGKVVYRQRAWLCFRVGSVLLLFVLVLLALERLL